MYRTVVDRLFLQDVENKYVVWRCRDFVVRFVRVCSYIVDIEFSVFVISTLKFVSGFERNRFPFFNRGMSTGSAPKISGTIE